MMLFHTDRKLLTSYIRPSSILVFHLFLIHLCTGQVQLIGPSQPIVATLGDDIILPCHLDPPTDADDLTLEWTRPDLTPRFVHVWRSGLELMSKKHESFKGRTSLFSDDLKLGNISLKLSKVRLSDEGTYRCYVPTLEQQSFVQVVVASDAISSPVIEINKTSSGVVLQCESEGWYPEPEVLWLDAEGNLLSAGPTETVRGPDDLYTVSSRVTVEKRHSNNFTCRVQQKDINQTRETHIHVPDDFFIVPSSSSLPLIIGLAVSLPVCIVFILAFVLRKAVNKTKRKNCDETDGEKNGSKSNKTKVQFVTETKREKEKLMTEETVQTDKVEKTKDLKKQRSEQKKRKKEAEKRVKTLKKELEPKKNEVQNKQAELQQLHEEKQRMERELQMLKEELEDKNKQLETIREERVLKSIYSMDPSWAEQQKKKMEEVLKEIETLKKQLETKETELQTKTKEFAEKQAELQKLQDENQRMETDLQTVEEDLENIKSLLERNQAETNRKLLQEKQKKQEAEGEVKRLKDQKEEGTSSGSDDEDSHQSDNRTGFSSQQRRH